jgi:hypothetical protein
MTVNHISDINIGPIVTNLAKINSSINWTESNHGKQAGLQYRDDEDPWTSAVGKSHGGELQYTTLNPFFKDTIFETLIEKYNLKRTRLMWVNPKSCYSLHTDETPRVHIPLVTNPECYFLFNPGILTHLSVGAVWWVDTRLRHTFLNCSNQSRLHLVGVVEK